MANTLQIIIEAKDKATKELQGVTRSTERMSKQLRGVGIAMVAVGVAITGALTAMTVQWAKAGDEVAKLAAKTGFTTETLSELRHAANLSGSSLASFETGIKRMQSTIIDARDGLSTAVRALQDLGLSYEILKDMTPEEQFMAMANALADIEDPTLKAATAVDVFGRAGTEMLPMLAGGSEALEAMRQEAHDLGLVFDEDAAKAAEAFNDSITRLKGAMAGIGAQIAKTLAPIITKLIETITGVIKKITEWADRHPALVKAITIVTSAIGLLALAFGSLILLLPVVIRLAPFVGMAFHTMLGPIGLVTGGISLLIGSIVFLRSRTNKLEQDIKDLGTAMVNDLAKAARAAIGPLNDLLSFFTGAMWNNAQRLTAAELETLEKINPVLAEKIRLKYAEIDAYDSTMTAIDKEQAAIRKNFLEQELLRDDLADEMRLQYRRELEEIEKGEAVTALGALMEEYKQEVINAVSPMVAAIDEVFAAFDEGFSGSLEDLRQFVVDFNNMAKSGLLDEETVRTVRDRLDKILTMEIERYAPPTLYQSPLGKWWSERRGFQYGGIVPGAKGQPVPIIAHGGEAFLGSNFDFSQLESRGGNPIYINLGLLPGDDITMRRLARMFKQFQDEDSRGSVFGQVSYAYGRNRL